jgi:hypothetical protein
MLKEILFKVKLFEKDNERDNSRRRLLWLLEALTQINKLWLSLHPETPTLYESDVIYAIEKGEIFRDIPTLIEEGEGDCDCLACWRAAEYQNIGIAARPYIKWRRDGSRWIYHAVVWLPGDVIEDPSMALGMGGAKIIRKPVYVQP